MNPVFVVWSLCHYTKALAEEDQVALEKEKAGIETVRRCRLTSG